MALIDDKIKQFKLEVGDAVLSDIQKKIFDIFVRKSGNAVPFTVIDKLGNKVRFFVYTNRISEGTQHILLKHFHGKEGSVSAFDILSICDTIKFGDMVVNDNKHICYTWERESGGKKIVTSLKIIKAGYILKSFYSEDIKKTPRRRLSSSPKNGARGSKSPRLGANNKKRGKSSK